MKKICFKCKRLLPLTSFKKHSKRKDGLQADCIGCQAAYRREHYKKNSAAYKIRARVRNTNTRAINVAKMKALKDTLKCNRCAENHPSCLQFHHRDPSIKEYAVSQMIGSYTWEAIEKEMEKCEVLCSNCHFKEHWRES